MAGRLEENDLVLRNDIDGNSVGIIVGRCKYSSILNSGYWKLHYYQVNNHFDKEQMKEGRFGIIPYRAVNEVRILRKKLLPSNTKILAEKRFREQNPLPY